jgi:hypothetical protein
MRDGQTLLGLTLGGASAAPVACLRGLVEVDLTDGTDCVR